MVEEFEIAHEEAEAEAAANSSDDIPSEKSAN
jgi:hypothetical protein